MGTGFINGQRIFVHRLPFAAVFLIIIGCNAGDRVPIEGDVNVAVGPSAADIRFFRRNCGHGRRVGGFQLHGDAV